MIHIGCNSELSETELVILYHSGQTGQTINCVTRVMLAEML